MSSIGKLPISIPSGVEIKSEKGTVTVKGPKGQLTQYIEDGITLSLAPPQAVFPRAPATPRHRALHGLYRSLINNMVEGVSKGYKIEQELVGVGYKASNQGQMLDLVLGYSHHVVFELPKEITVATRQDKGQNPIITLESYDKQLLGQVAAKIRSLRTQIGRASYRERV